jgi:hypothetical protein
LETSECGQRGLSAGKGPESQAISFCLFDKLAQPLTEGSGQLISNFDPQVYLPQLYRTHVSTMDSAFFGELFLRQSDPFTAVPNRLAECATRESSYLGHTLFV